MLAKRVALLLLLMPLLLLLLLGLLVVLALLTPLLPRPTLLVPHRFIMTPALFGSMLLRSLSPLHLFLLLPMPCSLLFRVTSLLFRCMLLSPTTFLFHLPPSCFFRFPPSSFKKFQFLSPQLFLPPHFLLLCSRLFLSSHFLLPSPRFFLFPKVLLSCPKLFLFLHFFFCGS